MPKDHSIVKRVFTRGFEACADGFSNAVGWIRKFGLRKASLIALAVMATFLIFLPSALTHSSLGSIIAERTAKRFGLSVDVHSISVGWFRPLKLRGVRLQGSHHKTPLSIVQIDSDLTLPDLLGLSRPDSGKWLIRGLTCQAYVVDNRFSFEEGIAAVLVNRGPNNLFESDHIQIDNLELTVTDRMTDAVWRVDRCDAQIRSVEQYAELSWSGVLSEEDGQSGSFRGNLVINTARPTPSKEQGNAPQVWRLELTNNAVPISAIGLIPRRFSNSKVALPPALGGVAEGTLKLTGSGQGRVRFAFNEFQLRDVQLTAAKGAEVLWSNQETNLDGCLAVVDNRLQAEQLHFSNDFTRLFLNGSVGIPSSFEDLESDFLTWLQTLSGEATAEIDLAALEELQFKGLKVEHYATVKSGQLKTKLAIDEKGAGRKAQIELGLSGYKSSSQRGEFSLPAVELKSSINLHAASPEVVDLELRSSFANIHTSADEKEGQTNFSVNLGTASKIAERILGRLPTGLEGLTEGQLFWKRNQEDGWLVESKTEIEGLKVSHDSRVLLEQPRSSLTFLVTGSSPSRKPRELTDLSVQLQSDDLDIRLALTKPIRGLHWLSKLPVQLSAEGSLNHLLGSLSAALPEQKVQAKGEFQLELQGSLTALAAELERADLHLEDLQLLVANHLISQPELETTFSGLFSLPSRRLEIQHMSATCPAFTAKVNGHYNQASAEIDAEIHSDLAELMQLVRPSQQGTTFVQTSNQLQFSNATGMLVNMPMQPAGSKRTSIAANGRSLSGDLQASIKIQGTPRQFTMSGDLIGKEFAILAPLESQSSPQVPEPQAEEPKAVAKPNSTTSFSLVGKSASLDSRSFEKSAETDAVQNSRHHRERLLWFEPEFRGRLRAEIDTSKATAETEELTLVGDWLHAPLSLKATASESQINFVLDGTLTTDLAKLSQHLSGVSGISVELSGAHSSPIHCEVKLPVDGPLSIRANTLLGWNAGEIAGLQFGAAQVPLQLNNTTLQLERTAVNVGTGKVYLGGSANLAEFPIAFELEPGLLAHSLHLSHEVTESWVKHFAPPKSRLKSVDSTLNLTIDRGTLFLGEPVRNRVSGRLQLGRTETAVNPKLQQMLRTYLVLREDAQNPQMIGTQNDSRVIMPEQSVKFWMRNGIINQDKITFQIGNQSVECTGNIGLDGQLNMLARIPRSLIRSDATVGKQERYLFVPVTGTPFFPQVDLTGIANLKTILTSTSMQRIRDNLDKQREAESELINQAINLAQELGPKASRPSSADNPDPALPVSHRPPAESKKPQNKD